MKTFSTREAARKLGLDVATLSRYIAAKKVPAPKLVQVGKVRLHMWTAADIEHVRQLLPKIANGRKTRYLKKESEVRSQKSAKAKPKTQARAPVPHVSSRKKK